MNYDDVLKAKARVIVNDFACAIADGGAEAMDYIVLYEEIVELAEKHAESVQYEAEQKLDEMGRVA